MSLARKLLPLTALAGALVLSAVLYPRQANALPTTVAAAAPAPVLRPAGTGVHRTVTTTLDTVDPNDGRLSLREAIAASAAGDSIDFAVSGTISLNDELLIGRAVTINGPGARKLAIDGHDTCRVLRVLNAGTLTASGLTLTRGRAPLNPRSAVNAYSDAYGGAILNEGTLALEGCAVTNSNARGESGSTLEFGGAAIGGGIFSLGSLTLSDCTVSGNRATAGTGAEQGSAAGGGGIFCGGPLLLLRTTIAGNIAQGSSPNGSGIGGGLALDDPFNQPKINFCTVADNTTFSSDGFTPDAGIVSLDSFRPAFRGSLIAGNHSGAAPSDMRASAVGTSGGHNLIGALFGPRGAVFQPSDLNGTPEAPLDPLLGPLRNNGGPTDTCALLEGSAAIDRGEDLAADRDQRGLPRPLGAHSDIGAYERDLPQPGPSFVVTTLEDTLDVVAGVHRCSLREALEAANGGGDVNTIRFQSGLTGIIHLSPSLGSLRILGPVTISGPGVRVLSISGGFSIRVFDAASPAAALSGLTILEGWATPGAAGGTAEGGGVRNEGVLRLNACEFVVNTARGGAASGSGTGGAASGGAVFNAPGGTLTATGCTFLDNTARGGDAFSSGAVPGNGLGGALCNAGTATLTNCTVFHNVAAAGDGIGGRGDGGGLANTGSLALLNCTVARNTSSTTGGGLFTRPRLQRTDPPAPIHARNTLIALNTAGVGPDAVSTIFSDGNNLVGVTDGSSGWIASDRQGTAAAPLDPKLSPAAANGGPTDTCALGAGTPAANAANAAFAPVLDQRGFIRNGPADIGAFELLGAQAARPSDESVSPNAGSSVPGAPRTFTCRYRDDNGASDLQFAYFLVNITPSGGNALHCWYNAVSNKLFLRNNADTAWLGGFAPGTAATISDPAGKGALDCAGTTVTRSGSFLTVSWSLVPNSRLSGTQNLFLSCLDKEGLSDGWDQLGTWQLSNAP